MTAEEIKALEDFLKSLENQTIIKDVDVDFKNKDKGIIDNMHDKGLATIGKEMIKCKED